MSEQAYAVVGLGVVNIALYSAAAYQLLRGRGPPMTRTSGTEAFVDFEEALRAADPSFPRGFTWREALSRAKALGVLVDWAGVERDVSAYEAYRYGGLAPKSEYGGVESLAKELRRVA